MPTRASRLIAIVSFVVNASMVAVIYFATINEFLAVAIIALLISKWRMLAARPRFWGRNFVYGACDLIFGGSIIALLQLYQQSDILVYGLIGLLAVWQLVVKPMKLAWAVGLQSFICLLVSQVAIWTYYPEIINEGLVPVMIGSIAAFIASYHLLRQLEQFEGRAVLYSLVWSAVYSQLAWLAWLWNVQYTVAIGLYTFYVPVVAVIACLSGYYLLSVAQISARRKRDQQKIWLGHTAFFLVLFSTVLIFTEWGARLT